MIDLKIIVDHLKAVTTLENVISAEAKTAPDLTGITHAVIVGRGKHEGGLVAEMPVCQQAMTSTIVVSTIAPESVLFETRNQSFNALVGMELDYYRRELEFESGEIEEVEGDIANWVDTYRVDWVWDARGGEAGTGGPWGN